MTQEVAVELGSLEVRFGDNPEMFREFTAQVSRTGSYAGELIGSTRVLRVAFVEETGLTAVDIEPWRDRNEPWDVDYLPQLSDDRKAHRIVAEAIKTVLADNAGESR